MNVTCTYDQRLGPIDQHPRDVPAQRRAVLYAALLRKAWADCASERQGHSEQRRYSESTFHKITYITLAQRAGFSLEEIAIQLTRVPDRFPLTKRHWGPLSEAWNTRIDQRIAEFKQLKIDIADCASRSSGRKY